MTNLEFDVKYGNEKEFLAWENICKCLSLICPISKLKRALISFGGSITILVQPTNYNLYDRIFLKDQHLQTNLHLFLLFNGKMIRVVQKP